MNEALRQLPAGDFQRIAALEFFDEHEILTQLLEHYCLSWATQGHSGNVSREDQTSTKIGGGGGGPTTFLYMATRFLPNVHVQNVQKCTKYVFSCLEVPWIDLLAVANLQ